MDLPPQVPDPELSRWFAEEVHAHEPLLKAYLTGSFPSVRDVDDIVQESYVRVWKAKLARPVVSAKAFLFQVARHLAIDAVRYERNASAKSYGDLSDLPVIEDKPNAVEALSYGEKVRAVAEALAALPQGCREILLLCKFKHLRHKEVAARLDISERTVQSQLARGMKLCEKRLRRRGIDGFYGDGK